MQEKSVVSSDNKDSILCIFIKIIKKNSIYLIALICFVIGLACLYFTQNVQDIILQAIGTSFLVGSLTILIDRTFFVSVIQDEFHKKISSLDEKISKLIDHQNDLIDNLTKAKDDISSEIERLNEWNRKFEGTIIADISDVKGGGTRCFLKDVLESLEETDHLFIIETFLDEVELQNEHGKKLYIKIDEILKCNPKLKISFIGLKYDETTRDQVLARSIQSGELDKFLENLEQFWNYVAMWKRQYNGRIDAKEINFLPSVAAFVIEQKEHSCSSLEKPLVELISSTKANECKINRLSETYPIREPREIFYAPIASSSSHEAPYFQKIYRRNDKSCPYITYINKCWVLGEQFDEKQWHDRFNKTKAQHHKDNEMLKSWKPFITT